MVAAPITIQDEKIREALQLLMKVNQEVQILISTLNILINDLGEMNQKVQQQLLAADKLKQQLERLESELEKLRKKERKEEKK